VPGTEKAIFLPALYGPDLGTFSRVYGREEITIGAAVPFVKGTAFTRMRILAVSGPLLLSIPVKKSQKDSLLSEIQVDNIQKWQNQHWRSLYSAYGKSPFFDYYKDELETLFLQKADFLAQYNSSILSWILKQYFPKIKVQVNLSASPPEPVPSDTGENVLPQQILSSNGRFRYRQVFGSEFVPGMSVLDHLFCAGPGMDWRSLDSFQIR
jgi:hypothetical protein